MPCNPLVIKGTHSGYPESIKVGRGVPDFDPLASYPQDSLAIATPNINLVEYRLICS